MTEAGASPSARWQGAWAQGGVLLLLLALALVVGLKLGTAQRESEEAHDPVAAYGKELRELEGRVDRLVPDLLGAGPIGTATELDAERAALSDLSERAKKNEIALDLDDARAALLRVRFEGHLRARNLDQAAKVAARFSTRPDGLLLSARLAMARGEQPPQGPLRVLTKSKNPRIVEAARVLLARLMSEEEPELALDLLREKVNPLRAADERDRPNLFLAAAKLDAQAVHTLVQRVDDRLLRRQVALRVITASRRLAAVRPVDQKRLEAALRILILLDATSARDAENALVFTRAVVEAARDLADGEPGVLLLEHLAEAGLRSGEFAAAGELLDALPDSPLSVTLRLRTLVAFVRLEARIQRSHLRGFDPAALDSLPRDAASKYLRYRIDLAAGSAIATQALHGLATGQVGKALGPIHRARALLIGSRFEGADEATLIERALALDPGSPWVRLGHARVLAKQKKPDRALDEAEGAHVLFDRINNGRRGADQERLRFFHELTLVHALRGDEALTEVFLKKLEKTGYVDHTALAQEARGILHGQ